MLSNGGLSTSSVAIQVAAQTLESGPAAGVIAQRALGEKVGAKNLVGLDMGGTSTDVSLILDGEQQVTPYQEVEFGAVVTLPSIDIKSIGAGGSSIAWVDKGGGLNVGPQSAGARPGPACYGLGGEDPTVTDANLVLGRLGERSLLGGQLTIDRSLAERAILRRVAEPLKLSVLEAAEGIVRIATHSMVNAVRLMTVEKGLDPRDFILFAYGGAGPMHAVGIAKELGMRRVLIPPHPGNTSALGLLMADVRHDFVQTVLQHSLHLDYAALEHTFNAMEHRARERLQREGIAPAQMEVVRAADLRYWGQTHDLTVAVPARPFDASVAEEVRASFDAGHKREFWHSEPAEHPVELVNLRVTGYGRLNKYEIGDRCVPNQADGPRSYMRPVLFEEYGFADTPVYDKDSLPTDMEFTGPAVIEQLDSTTVVYPGHTFKVDRFDNIAIDVN
jgi:N-methylhydantoinase A